jgi:ribonucleoside-triphosphate reductase
MAEKFLTDAGVSFTKVYADDAPELAAKYGVKQAPSLILQTGDSVMKIENVSNIRRYADTAKA